MENKQNTTIAIENGIQLNPDGSWGSEIRSNRSLFKSPRTPEEAATRLEKAAPRPRKSVRLFKEGE